MEGLSSQIYESINIIAMGYEFKIPVEMKDDFYRLLGKLRSEEEFCKHFLQFRLPGVAEPVLPYPVLQVQDNRVCLTTGLVYCWTSRRLFPRFFYTYDPTGNSSNARSGVAIPINYPEFFYGKLISSGNDDWPIFKAVESLIGGAALEGDTIERVGIFPANILDKDPTFPYQYPLIVGQADSGAYYVAIKDRVYKMAERRYLHALFSNLYYGELNDVRAWFIPDMVSIPVEKIVGE